MFWRKIVTLVWWVCGRDLAVERGGISGRVGNWAGSWQFQRREANGAFETRTNAINTKSKKL